VRRTLLALAIGTALLSGARVARAVVCDTDDAGSCATNEYCAYADGGAILDGAAGVCQPEPCVVASDCTNPTYPICDTSQNPFECVECISGSDCPGDLVCDVTNHTCVNPPPVPDASADANDGASEDASADATSTGGDGGSSSGDAATGGDGAPSTGGADASGTTDGAPGSGPPAGGSEDAGAEAGPDNGSLGGGAWDCELAAPTRAPFAAIGVTFALALMLFARKRKR
jgi:hypothetical protein